MKTGLFVCLIIGFISCEQMSVDIDIEEHGTQYKETVEFDPNTMAVTYKVPAHNDIQGSVTIIHKDSDTMMTMKEDREGNRDVCHLTAAPRNFDPETHAIGAFSAKIQNKTLTPGQATVRYILNQDLGKISEDQRALLLESMKTLCEGLDIIQIKEIEVSEEEFNQRTVNPFLNHTLGQDHNRVKRATRTFSKCTLQQMCDMGIPDARYCIWKVINLTAATEVEIEHIQTGNWACVLCCDEGTFSNGMCACDEIVDDASYNRCQHDD